ncbi:MAG: phosphate ABC transporter permease PstA [Clostridia bacterium]
MNQKTTSKILRALVYFSAVVTVGILAFIIIFIIVKGVPNLSPKLFSWKYTSENVSMLPSIVNTIYMTFLSLLFALPLGVFAAIYLVEYGKTDNQLVKFVRLMAETLAGIPSIVYGLFGYLVFGIALGWGYSLLGGALTLAIMVLPTIMRGTEEALLGVSNTFREGSFGLGAGRLRTVFKVVLPSAMNGILASVILSIGRIVGETASLIYTAGTSPNIPENVFGSARTLSVHLYVLWSEGFSVGEAYATSVVLIVLVILLNALSAYVAKRINKGK